MRAFLAAALCSVIAFQSPHTLASPEETTKCSALLTLSDPDSYKKKTYDARVSVFSAVPKNEAEYKVVYGTKAAPYTMPVKQHFDNASKLVDQATSGKTVVDRSSPKQGFDDFVKNAKASLVVAIGHNEGGVFHFLDGTKSKVVDMHATCSKAGKFCIFITCNAGTLLKGQSPCSGITCNITAEQSAKLLNRLTSRVADAHNSGKKVTGAELESAISDEASKFGSRVDVRLIVEAGIVIGIILVIYALTDDDEKDARKREQLRGSP